MAKCNICKLNPSGEMKLTPLVTKSPELAHCVFPGQGCKDCIHKCQNEAMYIGGMNVCGAHYHALLNRTEELEERLPAPFYDAMMAYASRDEVSQKEETYSGLASIKHTEGPDANSDNLPLDTLARKYPHSWAEISAWHSEDGVYFHNLSPSENRALKMFYFDGASYSEIGEALGIGRDGIAAKVARAKSKLAKHYHLVVTKLERINYSDETMGGYWDPEEAAIKRPVVKRIIRGAGLTCGVLLSETYEDAERNRRSTGKHPTVDSWLQKWVK